VGDPCIPEIGVDSSQSEVKAMSKLNENADLVGTLVRLKSWGDHTWAFDYPRLIGDVHDVFHAAIEAWEAGDDETAEKEYRELIATFPEFIDVHHHLALLLDETGRRPEALRIWGQVVDLGLRVLEGGFTRGEDLLPWGILDNRPFLRAYHGLAIAWLEDGFVKPALSIFNDILDMNPNDNQGVRALAIHCNFLLDQPEEVLVICDRYEGDSMEQVLYGRVLALFQLGRRAEAEDALSVAADALPLIAKELAKTRHRKPKDFDYDYIAVWSPGQAYYYWIEEGKLWRRTPGAIDFVREYLSKHEVGE
jgi:tetratricopeptide (TPR) repeat protein